MKLTATLLSRIFDPPFVIVVLTIIAAFIGNDPHQDLMTFLILMPFMMGGPFLYFLWKLKTRQVSNWDISKRQERVHPLFMLLGFLFVDILALSYVGNVFLLHLFMLYFVWVLGFVLITIFWKISGHSGITMLAFLLLLHWFGLVLWPFFIIVLLVSWARIIRHDHTPAQVVAGIFYSFAIMQFWSMIVTG